MSSALGQNLEALGTISATGVVHEEARRVERSHRDMSEARGERGERVAGGGVRADSSDDLDDFHDQRRVEEVKARNALGPSTRAGNRRHG